MKDVEKKFKPIAEKMRAEKLPGLAIHTFEYYYSQLLAGETGLLPEKEIEPLDILPDSENFGMDFIEAGRKALSETVLINLNGGLGTSMGLDKAKSLLVVKNDLSFLDIIAHQAIKAGVPLVLMNSFATREDSLAALEKYDDLHKSGIPLDFLQHKVPKIRRDNFEPVSWPVNPALEWCPPGHGDKYTALVTSGMLDRLISAGYRYAFVSNADNLGATLNERILGYFASNNIPFMMEAADRTKADRKGGHLARLSKSGHLILRESAQCPPEDEKNFQDVRKHRYFNTNNLWLNLPGLKRTMAEKDNILGLPMIRNSKTVDPRDHSSTPVYQLETAMGSAIAVFEGAQAIRVPRSRFAPVKTCDDLLAVRSDATILTEDFRVVPNPTRKLGHIVVHLDPAFYRHVHEMELRFPFGPPSLVQCKNLRISGDISFGRNVVLVGDVKLVNETGRQAHVPDGSTIEGIWKA